MTDRSNSGMKFDGNTIRSCRLTTNGCIATSFLRSSLLMGLLPGSSCTQTGTRAVSMLQQQGFKSSRGSTGARGGKVA